MLSRKPIKKKKCKEAGCENYPEMSMKGRCLVHADVEVKTNVITKRQQQARKRANLSNLKRKVYKAQDKIEGLKSPKKRQNKPIPKVSKKMAEKLIDKGWISWVGTDLHHDRHLGAMIQLSNDKKVLKQIDKIKNLQNSSLLDLI